MRSPTYRLNATKKHQTNRNPMPTCRRCNSAGPVETWGRYARSGRLRALCPGCGEENEAARQRNKIAREAGYGGWWATPEYKRLQREAKAAEVDREPEPYVPQDERNHRGRMRQAERLADQIRARWAAQWLRPFRSRTRDEDNTKSRDYYSRHRMQESARVQDYKTANQRRKLEWDKTREERIRNGADGTASAQAVRKLKRTATHCSYCGGRLIRKQTDHMVPLALGGEHSLRNIVIVCPDCNARKARLSYDEWVERIGPQHRRHVVALYQMRYAAEAA
jgi:hypothetical protein